MLIIACENQMLGFEAGGPNTPSNIDPWSVLGDESLLIVSTDWSSCFDRNKIALRMEVLCDVGGANACPVGGVGIYNPGFWGMVSFHYKSISIFSDTVYLELDSKQY